MSNNIELYWPQRVKVAKTKKKNKLCRSICRVKASLSIYFGLLANKNCHLFTHSLSLSLLMIEQLSHCGKLSHALIMCGFLVLSNVAMVSLTVVSCTYKNGIILLDFLCIPPFSQPPIKVGKLYNDWSGEQQQQAFTNCVWFDQFKYKYQKNKIILLCWKMFVMAFTDMF